MPTIPYVVEKSGREERVYDIYSRLLKDRIVFIGTPIDDLVANTAIAQMLFLQMQDAKKDIHVYINSPGGVIYAGLAIYDTMQMLRAPLSTIAVGWTASMGTVLLAGGEAGRRYALPHATVHMHPAGGGAQGYAPDVEIQYKELKRMQDLLHGILARHTGQTTEQIAEDFERDRFMDAHGAVDYGLVDEILGEAAIEPMEDDSGKSKSKKEE